MRFGASQLLTTCLRLAGRAPDCAPLFSVTVEFPKAIGVSFASFPRHFLHARGAIHSPGGVFSCAEPGLEPGGPWPAVLPADSGWQQARGCLRSECCSPRRGRNDRQPVRKNFRRRGESLGRRRGDSIPRLGAHGRGGRRRQDSLRGRARRSAAIARGNARGRDDGGRANDRGDVAASGDRPRTSAHIRAELRPGRATFACGGLSTGEVSRARIEARRGRQISPCTLAQAAWARSRGSPRRSFGARRSATDGTISSSRP